MTVKEYLSQLERLDGKIMRKQRELIEARQNRGICVTGNKDELVKVQTSFLGLNKNHTEQQALLIVAIQEELSRKNIERTKLKHRLIEEIYDLDDDLLIDILYRRYICQEKDYAQIACALGYSRKYTVNKHGEALAKFKAKYPGKFT